MTALLTATEAAQLRLGEQLVIVRPGDQEGWTETWYAPQAWVDLIGPCPHCHADGDLIRGGKAVYCKHPDHGRDGRRIVPLYAAVPKGCGECDAIAHIGGHGRCECECHDGAVMLVGRAAVVSIEPEDDGRNFRIIIDVAQVAE